MLGIKPAKNTFGAKKMHIPILLLALSLSGSSARAQVAEVPSSFFSDNCTSPTAISRRRSWRNTEKSPCSMPRLAKRLYAAIYGNLIVAADEKR